MFDPSPGEDPDPMPAVSVELLAIALVMERLEAISPGSVEAMRERAISEQIASDVIRLRGPQMAPAVRLAHAGLRRWMDAVSLVIGRRGKRKR